MADTPKVLEFTDEEKLTLKALNEFIILYDHQLRRMVGYIAEKNKIDLSEFDVAYDLNTMTYTVTPTVKKEAVKND